MCPMEMKDFIANFADQFEETEVTAFSPETRFRELDEWGSIIGLASLNMIAKKYGVQLKVQEMRQAQTVQELFDLVQSKLG